ncbi:MAG: metal-dependent hydrolase [Enterobacterales bacterium]
MTGKGHLIFALASIFFVKKINLFHSLSQGHWGHVIIGTICACLIPDIDHPQSILGQRVKFISVPIIKVFGHRSLTHSLFAVFIFSFFIITLNNIFNIAIPLDIVQSMIVGYISHIIADFLTPSGVYLLWPLHIKFRISIIQNSIWEEKILCLVILILVFIYPYKLDLMKFLKNSIHNYLYNNIIKI